MVETVLITALLLLLVAVAIGVAMMRNLFAAVMLTGIFSLLCAGLFVVLDAVDVAFTEAAVGAGVATVLMLATLALSSRRQRERQGLDLGALTICGVCGFALILGVSGMPAFGDPQAPANVHLATYFLQQSPGEIDVPNVVTAVLASYRGYDTLGEVAVIFTGGVGVLALVGQVRRSRRERD